MNKIVSFTLCMATLALLACADKKKVAYQKPNIFIAIADDASFKHFGAYGTEWVKTPNFDRIAREGILFTNAYTPNAKCAPSRANILTGRNPWQLEEAGNHGGYFPEKYTTFPEVLKKHGYSVGYTGKGWAPGNPGVIDGKTRQLIGTPYQEKTLEPLTAEISNTDYVSNFIDFMDDKSAETPFLFWYGGYEPHRSYEFGTGIDIGGKKVGQIKSVPTFFPDNDTVRTDLLDYALEIEYFDKKLGEILDELEERDKLENTLVIVTADNGMPFPRVKGQAYKYSHHMPLAMRWPKGIEGSGREITDFVSFIDFAPTLLEIAGISEVESGMQPITGRSLTNLFSSSESGRIDLERDHVLIGKERHDLGRPNDEGYPIRGIVTDEYLYVRNFKNDRWPAGNPETGYLNTDGSPTKTWILNHQYESNYRKYWKWAFGKREVDELYDLQKDPMNIDNLILKQENESYQVLQKKFKAKLFQELKDQGDPRMFDKGHLFDEYPHANENRRGFYGKYMNGSLEEADVGWVNPSDFDKSKL